MPAVEVETRQRGGWERVTDGRLLQRFAREGHIRKPKPTCRPRGVTARWGSGYAYVDTREDNPWPEWQDDDFEYRIRYTDGCFFPFVQRRRK